MSDRRTLQRATIFDSISLPPSSESMTTKSDRRVSLPSPSKNPSSFLGETPIPRTPPRHVSLVPQLGTIPPTPAEELQGLNFPVTPPPPFPRSVSSPIPREPDPSPPTHAPRTSFTSSSPTSTKSGESPLTRRPSLRTRRWSELRPSNAVQAITSALLPSTSSTKTLEDLSTDEMEYKVIEAYHAPVWVPDSKVGKCTRCANGFGLWRRKHHCRLCGGIVCWACSTQVSSSKRLLLIRAVTVFFRSDSGDSCTWTVFHHSRFPPFLLFYLVLFLLFYFESSSSARRPTCEIVRHVLHGRFR